MPKFRQYLQDFLQFAKDAQTIVHKRMGQYKKECVTMRERKKGRGRRTVQGRKDMVYYGTNKGHGVLMGQTKDMVYLWDKQRTWCTAGQTKDMVYYETESTKVHYRAQARKEVYLYAHCENNLVV